MEKIKFPLEELKFTFGEILIRIFRPLNRDQLFDEILSGKSDNDLVRDERIPYWCDLWPSALGLAAFLQKNNAMVGGKRVMEIGCGLGLPGILAGKLGAQVTLTDYIDDALLLAGHNWRQNLKSEPHLQTLDWRCPKNVNAAEVLLASDIAYESRSFAPIVKSLNSLVQAGGIIILSEPNRKFATKFFDALSDAGFESWHQTENIYWEGINYEIGIHVIRKIIIPETGHSRGE